METVKTLSTYELERGKPMPSRNHGIVQAFLVGAFLAFADQYTIMSESTIDFDGLTLTPDISVYPKISLDWVHDEIRMTTPPLLVVEILSPRQYMYDLIEKVSVYHDNGVKSCWIVQPALKSIAIFTPGEEPAVHVSGEIIDPATQITVHLDNIFR
jgi:Uma2 family endonuclease